MQLRVIKAGNDQQNGIGAQRSSLPNLVSVQGKVLAQYRQLARRPGLAKEFVSTLEEINVG